MNKEIKVLYSINTKSVKIDQYKNKEEFKDGLVIEGIANKAIIDSVNDLVLPSAYDLKRADIMPLLFNHDHDKVVGQILELWVEDDGLHLIAYIDPIAEEEFKLVSKVKKGLIKAFSIGFLYKDIEYDEESEVWIIKKAEILEVSLVTVPANYQSTISDFKNLLNQDKKNNTLNKPKGGKNMDLQVILDEIKKMQESITTIKEGNENETIKELTAKVDELVKEKETIKEALTKLEKEDVSKSLEELKGTLDGLKTITDEVKTLKETIEELKAEMEEVKNAKPKVEVTPTNEKDIEENIDKYVDIFFEASAFKKDVKDSKIFQSMPERLKSVTFDSNFTNKVKNKIISDIKTNAPVLSNFQDFSFVGAKTTEYPFGQSASAAFGALTLQNVDMSKKITFDLKSVRAGIEYSYVAEEESIITWLPFVRQQLIDALSDTIEQEVLAATPSSAGFTGLLKYAEDASFTYTDASTTNLLTVDKLRSARALMGKYALAPKDVMVILNPSKYLQLLDDDTLQTVDKMGSKATLLNGQVAAVEGMPVIVTSNITLNDTDAAGNYSALLANRKMFGIMMRDILVEIDKNIQTQNKQLVCSVRVSFVPLVYLNSGVIPSTYTICAAVENA